MSKKTIELKIVATGHKLNAEDSLLVLVSPEYTDYIEGIYESLELLTGHNRHTVWPIQVDRLKVFSIKHPITISQEQVSDLQLDHPEASTGTAKAQSERAEDTPNE